MRGQSFKVTPQYLTSLFQPDNINSGKSVDILLSQGGLPFLQQALQTNLTEGISQQLDPLNPRITVFGINSPITKPPITFLEMVLQNFEDQMLRILCAAAIVSLILGIATQGLAKGWIEGVSILIAVIIIVSVTSINNYMKEQQFRKLNAIASQKFVNCYRNGNLVHMSVYELTVGDVVEVETGQIMSVDGIIINSNQIHADQSGITGQAHEVYKCALTNRDTNPFLVSGSKIVQGTGTYLVLAVGLRSQYGSLKMRIQQDSDDTPLQQKLQRLATQIGNFGVFAAVITFLAMFINYIIDCIKSPNFRQAFLSMKTVKQLIADFIVGVSIIVVAIPEGLPLAVTIALAYSVSKMKDQNNLVRYLQACETMGGVNNICSDKTGTLTKNHMTVTHVLMNCQMFSVLDQTLKSRISQQELQIFAQCISQNSTANPILNGVSQQIGNKTECAMLELIHHLGYDYRSIREPRNIIAMFPFSSERKKMTTVCMHKGSIFIYSKGAPEYMIDSCSFYHNQSGQVVEITPQYRHLIHTSLSQLASKSLRSLIIAYKYYPATHHVVKQNINQLRTSRSSKRGSIASRKSNPLFNENPDKLVFLALVGIKDPLREGIQDAVLKCQRAGITVRMLTGDNKQTAIAIAKEAGIISHNSNLIANPYIALQGRQFRQFVGGLVDEGTEDQRVGNIQNFKVIDKHLRVMARCSPTDKYIMAVGLKQLENVVAMTGDGTNDAPALKKSDIGLAMGIAGTQVAKQAAGIILLDDNFASIVTAVKWGRNIFDCIRKFIQFQLTVNVVALVMAFTGAVVLKYSPLNPVQMLWVNLIMDTLASLALATQPPSDSLLLRKPYSRYESILTGFMLRNIIIQSIFQIVLLGFILFKCERIFGDSICNDPSGPSKKLTLFFNTFVFLQVFNEINSRKLYSAQVNVFGNFFNNFMFLFVIILTTILQVTFVQFAGKYLKTVPLSLHEHLMCIGIASSSLVICFLSKLIIPHFITCQRPNGEFGVYCEDYIQVYQQ